MQFLIFALLLLLATFTASNAQVINGSFTAPLDYFRPQNTDRLLTFYYEANFQYYESGGPFYIFIKSARETSHQWIERGLMVDIAEETRGALFTFTRRFYGIHRPTQNVSFENLELHTLEQSLHDIATFIQYLRNEVQHDSKVILWGSNNGATMANWARMKFPHLVDGVWSSSGVYYTDLYTSWEFLQDKFNICHPVDTDSILDVPVFYETQIRNVFSLIQARNTNGILDFCRDMEAIPGDPFSYHVEKCRQIFGENYNSALVPIANANLIREYGSIHPVVSNVIFTNGEIDPYMTTGIVVSQNPNTVVIIIEGYARSSDLTSINLEVDTPILVAAKEQIRNQIIQWSLCEMMFFIFT